MTGQVDSSEARDYPPGMRIPDSVRPLIPRKGIWNGLRTAKHFGNWRSRGYSMPAPPVVKRAVLQRWGKTGAWVETGTYLGDTTAFLGRLGSTVVSIEPVAQLAEAAKSRFAGVVNIRIVNGTSEEVFEEIVSDLSGPVSFWLDGHYSGGVTLESKSKKAPILHELDVISRHLEHLSPVTVLIDDARCFDPSVDPQYPHRRELVAWADRNGLNWTFEHDIFVSWN